MILNNKYTLKLINAVVIFPKEENRKPFGSITVADGYGQPHKFYCYNMKTLEKLKDIEKGKMPDVRITLKTTHKDRNYNLYLHDIDVIE